VADAPLAEIELHYLLDGSRRVIAIVRIRDFHSDDAPVVNRIALAAWGQYATVFSNWTKMAEFVGNVASLADDL
jgi:hypothetical protein